MTFISKSCKLKQRKICQSLVERILFIYSQLPVVMQVRSSCGNDFIYCVWILELYRKNIGQCSYSQNTAKNVITYLMSFCCYVFWCRRFYQLIKIYEQFSNTVKSKHLTPDQKTLKFIAYSVQYSQKFNATQLLDWKLIFMRYNEAKPEASHQHTLAPF